MHFYRAALKAVWFGVGVLLVSGGAVNAVTQDILGIGSTSFSLSQTSIDFFSVGGANTIDLGASTGAFATLGGNTATMQNVVGGSGPVSNFLTIPALPQAQFTLTGVGSAFANTICAGLGTGGSCAASAGSPYILTQTSAGTAVSFSASGTVKDNFGATTAFVATFSTEVTGQSPSAVQTKLNTGGTLASPFSASINVPSGTFAGTLNIGLSSTSLSSNSVGFSSSNVIGPTSTGAFSALSGTTATLTNVNSLPLANFLAAAGLPQVTFTLTGVDLGLNNTNCAGLGIGGSCAASVGSPYILVNTGGGTAIFFSVFGTALDTSTNAQTTFEAIFSTNFADESAQSVQAILNSGGPLDGPLSVEFLAGPFGSQQTPLPAALPLFATGLGALGLLARRRKRKAFAA